MNRYELLLVFAPHLGEEERRTELEEIKELLVNLGGSLEGEEDWGKRELAYEIRHYRDGFYFILNLAIPALKVAAFKKELLVRETLLRFFLSKSKL